MRETRGHRRGCRRMYRSRRGLGCKGNGSGLGCGRFTQAKVMYCHVSPFCLDLRRITHDITAGLENGREYVSTTTSPGTALLPNELFYVCLL